MLEWSKSERYVNSLSLYTMKFRDWRYYLIDSKDLEFKIYLDFPQFKLSNGGSHITLYLLCYIILYLYLLIFFAVKPLIPIFIVLKILESLWN